MVVILLELAFYLINAFYWGVAEDGRALVGSLWGPMIAHPSAICLRLSCKRAYHD